MERIIKDGGIQSRQFWNIYRQQKKPNSEDIAMVVTEDGKALYSPEEIMEHNAIYYTNLYSPRTSPNYDSSWTTYIENVVKEYENNREYENIPLNQPLKIQEIVNVQTNLPKNKSCGPDTFPNEFIIHGGPTIVSHLYKMMYDIFETENIPQAWGHGHITNIGKGSTSGKLSDQRGLSLTSNLSKFMERILKNRIGPNLPFTWAQAGGCAGRSATDQLFAMKSVLQQRLHQKKTSYVAFLDLSKAFDKVWRAAVFHILWQRGIRGKVWRIAKKLCSNLTASINTKYGRTRLINIIESLRQGGVLSSTEFATLIDEVEIDLKNLNAGIWYEDILISSLLLLDDIALFASSPMELQSMLDAVYTFISKWHLDINEIKCKVVIFGQPTTMQDCWFIGPTMIPLSDFYKYMGEYILCNLSLEMHIKEKGRQVRGMMNICMATAADEIMQKIYCRTLLELHHRCIIPSIINSCEGWTPTRKDIVNLENLQIESLRGVLMVPKSTPKVALLGELGVLPVEIMIHQRMLTYLWKLINHKTMPGLMYSKQATTFISNTGNFHNHIMALLNKYHLPSNSHTIKSIKKTTWKNMVKKSTTKVANDWYYKEAKSLKKLADINQYKYAIERENYIHHLSRKHASIIFRLRTNMLLLKANMRNSHVDTRCTMCGKAEETTRHIFKCENTHTLREVYDIPDIEPLYTNQYTEHDTMKRIAQFLERIEATPF